MEFGCLKFNLQDNAIEMSGLSGAGQDSLQHMGLTDIHLCGSTRQCPSGNKLFMGSEYGTLEYVTHTVEDKLLTVIQQNSRIKVTTYYQEYKGTTAVRVWSEVENISKDNIILESVSSFVLPGLGRTCDSKDIYLTRFSNSMHVECQPRTLSLFDLGFFEGIGRSYKQILGINTGSCSTKSELAQAIVHNKVSGLYLMFQIESNTSWCWEIGEHMYEFYLILSGPNELYNHWHKELAPGKVFITQKAAIAIGGSLDEVVGSMTEYRRQIIRHNLADRSMPVIFNEYMHLSWDSPMESRTARLAPVVADMGAEYYVIDCGWHNEEPGNQIYPYVGQWKESKTRFPSGIKYTIDRLHSHGLKAGLWLEPEIIGQQCKEMLDYYDDDCFIMRNGQKVGMMDRCFLDFRNSKVKDYLSNTVKYLVEDCGVDYLKFDYNEDMGTGTELNSDSCGDGLLSHATAYLKWVENIMDKYPNLIIESCASGGQRMDYLTLSLFPLCSTSDQTKYRKYPYIAGNIFSSVLPEQGAVWSYPVDSRMEVNAEVTLTYEEVNSNVDEEAVVMNMVNSLLGRMHLASDISLLSKEKQALIKEGIKCYNALSEFKKTALPFFPLGFCDFSSTQVATGLRHGNTAYLAVWNLSGSNTLTLECDKPIKEVTIIYPVKLSGVNYKINDNFLTLVFSKEYQARLFRMHF